MSEFRRRYVALVLSASATFCATLSNARADVGQNVLVVAPDVSARAPWRGLTPTIGKADAQTGPLHETWEHDTEPEERRFVVASAGGISVVEHYERTTRTASYSLAPMGESDLNAAISRASRVDFRTATLVSTIQDDAAELTLTFYRGKKWGYAVTRATVAQNGARTYVWTQFARTDLARRIAAAKACASSGECGE